MANAVTRENTIFLGAKHFPIMGSVQQTTVSRFPPKQTIGPSDYATENVLDNWIINDQRGGIGIEEMDESIHSDRCWWTNCIIDYNGHMRLPRLASVSSKPTMLAWTDTDLELWDDATHLTNWTGETTGANPGSTDRESSIINQGTYSAKISAGAASSRREYQDAANWVTGYRGATISLSWYCRASAASAGRIQIDDGIGTSESAFHTGGGTWELLTVTHTFAATATRCRVYLRNDLGADTTTYFDGTAVIPSIGTLGPCRDFNSHRYWAAGSVLLELNSAGSAYNFKWNEPTGATITHLVASLNDCLYIMCGDSTGYWYMTSADPSVFAEADEAYYWGLEWDNKFLGFTSTGVCKYDTAPAAASPAFTAYGTLTSVTGWTLREPLIYQDATGADIVYWPTNGPLFAHDAANAAWVRTKVLLSGHPNGGFAIYIGDSLYLSEGLAIKRYIVGTTATMTNVGLDLDDGLPLEFNGEIVGLMDVDGNLAACVDSTQTSGSTNSGLYIRKQNGWSCWYSILNQVVNTGGVSGIYEYRLWFRASTSIYYIPLPRGVSNPMKLSTQTYDALGYWRSSWFDGGTAAFNKVLKKLTTYCKNLSATSTVVVKYRINKTNTDFDTGFTTIATLVAADNGQKEILLASGAGLEFETFQIGLDLARAAGTTTDSPDIQSIVTSYRRETNPKKAWTFEINLAEAEEVGSTPKVLYDLLQTYAYDTVTFLEFTFRDGVDSTQTHYVFVQPVYGLTQTGHDWQGTWRVTVVEP